MKKIILVVLTFYLVGATAQPEGFKSVTAEEKTNLVNKITEASKKTQSMQCNFTQDKKISFMTETSSSSGIMYYKNPTSIRWEYLTPQSYLFIVHNDKIYLKNNQGGASQFNANGNKMFKAMSEMILGFINGKELQNSHNFKIEYYLNEKQVLVKLIPIQKEMKQMMTSIELYLDPKNYLAQKIIMNEKNGDTTLFTFKNIQRNISISDSKFNLQ
ncbi:MAG: outer membrane lipoprotein carrier protein LolA [Bacteroidales bacterium]